MTEHSFSAKPSATKPESKIGWMELFEFENGKFVEKNSVTPQLELFFGVGFFETVKVIGGVPVFLTEHIKRAENGIRNFFGDFKMPAELESEVMRICKGRAKASLRLFFVPSLESGEWKIRAVIEKFPDVRYPVKIAVLQLCKNDKSPSEGLKPTSYFDNIITRHIIKKHGFEEGIFLSQDRKVAEGTRSNIFWIKNQKVFTPSTSGILEGITRRNVIAVCRKMGFQVLEGKFEPEELAEAEECFLTSSLLGVAPVSECSFFPQNLPAQLKKIPAPENLKNKTKKYKVEISVSIQKEFERLEMRVAEEGGKRSR